MSTRFVIAISFAIAGEMAAAPFTATEMMKLRRLADPQASPDGRFVAYVQTEVDMAAGGTRNSDVWLVPAAGGPARRLTTHAKSDSSPRWSPDGKRLAFLSSRDGQQQIYTLDPSGSAEPTPITTLATGVDAFVWIDVRTLLVKTEVFPDCSDDACNKRRLDEPKNVRVYDALLHRHWDTWEDGRRSHLFTVDIERGPLRDLTPGERDVPPWSLGGEDFAVSPDGSEVCFSRNDDPMPATSTNADLFVVPVAGGEPKKIAHSPGYDGSPRYSPDGTRIAFRAQQRAGYESDRWRLVVFDRKGGQSRTLTETFDRHVESFAWSRDGKALYFVASEAGRDPIYVVSAAGGEAPRLVAQGTFGDLQPIEGGRHLVATQAALTHPPELVRIDVDGSGTNRLTHVNDEALANFSLRAGESVSYTGAAGKNVQAWIVKPPDFSAQQKYPLVVLIHGGPQGVWADGWSWRWNPQLFAAAGYVVFMPNPRGSIGWGQEFIDDVNADWGGRAYEDVMKGTDFAEALPYVARGRTTAAGASYGGYLINWILGHSDRFRALVSHDGVYDLVSMYGSTEELWFTDWEFKGPYWEHPEQYERWSPSRFVSAFKTPTLVIHGEQDFRVPLEQGLSLFTALQRKGVPSRLVVFADENHWVLKPANSVRWYREVLGWLDKWTKP